MGRSEQRMKERDAARERSKTPYVAPDVDVQIRDEKASRRGGGVRNRGQYQLPNMLQPSQISTPARGLNTGRGKRNAEPKPAAPAQPAVKRGRNLPPSAAVPGTGPKNNQVGSDADPNQPGLQGSADPVARTNSNGLKQYGKDLSSLNAFTSAFTGGYELTDIKSAFQSNTLPGAAEYGANTHQLQNTPYELADDATPSNTGGKYAMDGVDTSLQSTGYQIGSASVPGTLGKDTDNPQSGASDKPDIAENVRTIRMNRRDQIRSTFLDMDTPIIQASIAANAIAGYGKDRDGTAQFNYGGELVQAKEGMQQKAKNAAMMGKDPSEFLDIKVKEVQEKQKDKK